MLHIIISYVVRIFPTFVYEMNTHALPLPYKWILALMSGGLLALSWPPFSLFTGCIFISFIPLLYIAYHTPQRFNYFILTYAALLLWNVLCIGWIVHSTWAGGIFTIMANALLQVLPFLLFHYAVQKKIRYAPLVFIAAWMGFELFHFHWEIHFPWLTLGHAFAMHPAWIQWYEYTGVAGGTLWILLGNSAGLHYLRQQKHGDYTTRLIRLYPFVLSLLLPLAISLILYQLWQHKLAQQTRARENAVIVQPNIECYNEKFALSELTQTNLLIQLSEAQIDAQTRYVIWPETALTGDYWEDTADSMRMPSATRHTYHQLREWLQQYPQLQLVTGLSSFRKVTKDSKAQGIRKAVAFNGDTLYHIIYNTSGIMNADGFISFYHKSKLVPGVETVPFARYLSFMDYFIVDMGGISGTLGVDETTHNFQGPPSIAPLICYESIYGDYVASFVGKGAALLFILTNDGWWQNTKGYQQHAFYGTLRAIESRRYIFRSANTGISYIADPLGNILDSLGWDKRGSLKYPLYPRQALTFYTRYPNLLYQMASMGLGLWLAYHVYHLFRARCGKKNKL